MSASDVATVVDATDALKDLRKFSAAVAAVKSEELVPLTLTDVKDQGLTAGAVVPAQLAPQSGTIPAAAGTIVAGVLKKFSHSRTIQVALGVIGLGIAFGLMQFKEAADVALLAGHHVFEIPWTETAYKAIDSAYKWIAGGGVMIVMKLIDNDPVNPPGAGG